jgi:hypothetical protein
MAVSEVSTGQQNTGGPLGQSPKEIAGMQPPGTHDPDQTHLGRILDS